MTTPLLTTKIYIPPPHKNIVSRPHLIKRLNTCLGPGGFSRKLTLISAPAGFGKTTLLSHWISNCRSKIANLKLDVVDQGLPNNQQSAIKNLNFSWLSLDEGDNDPASFLAYFIAALQTIDPNIGEGALSLLQSPQPPAIKSLLAILINEIAAIPMDIVLILDDYHVIEAQPIDQAIIYTLDHLPPRMHLVIASRTDPILPLPRLRGSDQLTELRADDLRFSFDEIAAFLKEGMGLNLSTENVAALESRTEGWIVGLQLAAQSMQGLQSHEDLTRFINSFTGSHRYILDYLTDEVLQQRPKGTKDFLLQTSILDRMSGPLCDAVSGSENSQDILESLEAANLFIVPLDNERRWYRYHHLFGDLLCKRLLRTGAGQIQELHRRASRWHEENGSIPEAVDHALATEDYARAARLVEQGARQMLEASELARLTNWVDALPDEYIRTRPWLCIFYAWALRLSGGQLDAVESRLQDAEQALNKPSGLLQTSLVEESTFSREDSSQILGHIAAIRAYQALYREEIPRVIELAHQALEYRPEGNFVRSSIALALGWAYRFSGDLIAANKAFDEAKKIGLNSGNIYMAVAATCRAAHGQVLMGKLHQGVDSYQDALKIASKRDGRRLPVAGYAYVYLGGVYREWDQLDTAARYLVEGIQLCQQVGYIMDQVIGYVNLARVRQAQGDWDSAREAVINAEQLSLKMKGYLYVRRWVEDCQTRLWLAQGNLDAATAWAQESDLGVEDEVNYLRELEHIILARVLVALGREHPGGSHLDGALKLLERLQRAAETAVWMGKEIEILVLQSLALQAKGENEGALAALKRALTLAEPEGYMRIFVDEGEPMAVLLRQADSRGFTADYVGKLLAAIVETTKDEGRKTRDEGRRANPPSLIESLSEREIELLRLIAAGLTNQEIAQRLFIAPTTAKKHVSNIIGKLGVTNRTQAVTRASELNLI